MKLAIGTMTGIASLCNPMLFWILQFSLQIRETTGQLIQIPD